jgi:hypothetical protein
VLFEDEDDIFVGSPRSKYFDIIFTANQGLSEQEIDKNLDKIAAMEMLLEEMMGEDKDLEQILQNFIVHNDKRIEARKIDLYINGMGNIVTQSEG